MRIAIDAMGGDHAPGEIVAGCLAAAEAFSDTHLLVVGQEAAIRAALTRPAPPNFEIVPADDVIAMDDDPAKSIRRKPDSSLVRSARLVADGEAQAVFSAGNTGAVTAAAMLTIGRLPGVFRPGIATVLPTAAGSAIVCDVGASVDSKAEWVVQFGVMASIYAEEVEGRRTPRVGLLNIGEEASKGDKTTKRAHELFADAGVNWIGNVDGKDTFRGVADVIACDGFHGNLLLKVAEGAAEFFIDLTKQSIASTAISKFGGLLIRPAMRGMKQRIDYSEYGGAFLLGIKGLVVIGHGRSSQKAITSAISRTREGVRHRLVSDSARASADPPPSPAGRAPSRIWQLAERRMGSGDTMQGQAVGILGAGFAVPGKRVTNDDLARTIETSDEWIRTRTGIVSRHILANGDQTSDLATLAAERAIADAGIDRDAIDAVIVATVSADMPFPNSANLVQHRLGLRRGPAFDLSAACAGYIYALDTAAAMIQTGRAGTVLVVGADALSKMLDWTDRSTCVLFGDGAGATVVGRSRRAMGCSAAISAPTVRAAICSRSRRPTMTSMARN